MGDVMSAYGGSILAVATKDCVAIVQDFRLGNGFITTSKCFERVHQITKRAFVCLPAFLPDAQHLLVKIKKHAALFSLDEGRDIEPDELASLVSYLLYSRRTSPLFTTPIVAGICSNGKPYICGMDSLGCMSEPGSFVAAGTAENNLIGLCEALYRPDADAEGLFTVAIQTFLNAVDRDILSGWGAKCIILTPEKQIVRKVRGRCD